MESNPNLIDLTSNEIWKPNVFVLGPGGARGYLELGLMLKFEQENYLSNVDTYIGCSVGSSIALLIIAGYKVNDIINDCIDMNLINDITDINLENLKESPGLLRIKTVEDLLKVRIQNKFGMIPTLKQLYMATGIVFIVVTFNLDKMRKEYLSKDTDPGLSCVEAVMMSMAIPALICPRIYKGNVYVDGAIGDPYPISILDNGYNDILGVYIESEQSVHSSDRSIPRYLYRCAQASMKVLRDQAIEQASNRCKHIVLKTSILDSTGISLTNEAKRSMIESGYKTANIFLMKIKDPIKYNVLVNDNEEFPIVDDILSNDGVLDSETRNMLNMLSNTNHQNNLNNDQVNNDQDNNDQVNNDQVNNDQDNNDHGNNDMNNNDHDNNDLYISDVEDEEENEQTLIIPITPEFSLNIDRMMRYRQNENKNESN